MIDKLVSQSVCDCDRTMLVSVLVLLLLATANDEINSNEANSQIIEVPVLDIEFAPITNTNHESREESFRWR